MTNIPESISYIQLNDGLDPHPIDAVSIEGKLISDFQEAGKIVQTISASSTDDEIPSAKCIYELVWGSYTPPVHDYSKDYLTFEALEDTTFKFTRNALEYSVDDGNTWTNLPASTNTPTVASGDKIMFKQTDPTIASSNGIGTFSSTGKFNVSGNIMSLLYGDDFDGQISLSRKNFVFARLFYNCKMISASNLILPATALADFCYYYMFYNCTSLTTAPALPTTTLANSCYESMFRGCTSLTTSPELPATTLKSYCYYSMFRGCTSLTTSPELPATTLEIYCYQYMFYDCTSLTTAPALPATTLESYCYQYMFQGCTGLTTAPALPATALADKCYSYMFYGCTSLTTAPELPATTLADGCYSFMFYNCTSLTTSPALPATTLADRCYYYMFQGCTGLTISPALPATTLADECYSFMFYNTNIIPDCTNIDFLNDSVVSSGGLCGLFAGTKVTDQDLNNILPKNTNGKYYLPKMAIDCYQSMFYNCTSLTTAPELPATTLADRCYNFMFYNCTSLTTAPALPATALVDRCYNFMFYNCTSLTTAPELPATALVDSCYNRMFFNCSKLNSITCYATTNITIDNLGSWVYGVSRTGTFTGDPSSIWPTGDSGVPTGWSSNVQQQ